MTESRRFAWRLRREGAGWLAAPQFRAACTIEDISLLGARVRVSSIRRDRSIPLPRELTLTTVLARQKVTLDCVVMRAANDSGTLSLALRILNGEAAGLEWMINQAQREDIFGPPERPGAEPPDRSGGRRKRRGGAEATQRRGQQD